MVDNDDHSEDEDEDEDEVVVDHSSVVDDHNHKVQVEVMGHCILAVERDVVAALDHSLVDAYQADNFLVDHNKVDHEDYHREDIVVDVVAWDNVKQVDEVDEVVVANLVDFGTCVEEVEDERLLMALIFVDWWSELVTIDYY